MDKQEERTVIVMDGAYSGTENIQLAADKNVELITTSQTGKPALDILADFEFNEEGTKFKNYARLRNGVATVPSNIRKNYHLEKMPRGKFFFGSKIAA